MHLYRSPFNSDRHNTHKLASMAEDEEPHTRIARVVFAHRSKMLWGSARAKDKSACAAAGSIAEISLFSAELVCLCSLMWYIIRAEWRYGRPTPALDPCPSHSHPRVHPADLESPLSQFLWCKFVIKLSRGSHRQSPTTSRTCVKSLWR
jgi:hypothetical protein